MKIDAVTLCAVLSLLACAIVANDRVLAVPPEQHLASYAVVVREATAKDVEWKKVVDALERKHKATVITYVTSVDEALDQLSDLFPRYTCFVAKPEDAGRLFVAQVHQLTRQFDDDPYADTLWGVLTGYDAANALEIATTDQPLVVKKVASGTEFAADMVTEGQWYDELVKNKHVRKELGQDAEQLKGPDDTTKPIVNLLNEYHADAMITSGHATERDWQIGFRYKNGYFRCADGTLFGLDTNQRKHVVNSPNPKVYLAIGNCRMGHVVDQNAMALAWMNSAGVRQMIGYTVDTWYGYGGWGCLDYFIEQPGRYTFAEAFHANHHALIHRLETYFPQEVTQAKFPLAGQPRIQQFEMPASGVALGLKPFDAVGLLYDRDVVALYGDPKWSAKMASLPKCFDQQLEQRDQTYTLTITPKRGAASFEPVNMNGSQRGWRPFVQFLPHRIQNAKVMEGMELNPIVTDDFILVPNPGAAKPQSEYRIVLEAQPL